jgi:hypothetical protein
MTARPLTFSRPTRMKLMLMSLAPRVLPIRPIMPGWSTFSTSSREPSPGETSTQKSLRRTTWGPSGAMVFSPSSFPLWCRW